MMNFLKTKTGTLVIAIVMTVLGVLTGFLISGRFEARDARQTQQRIEREVKSSINNAAKDIKLCPLSDPDCYKR
jgi:heme/copper-type cytochrome/quinol oxidase subunit 2